MTDHTRLNNSLGIFQPVQLFIYLSVHPSTNTLSFSLLKYIRVDTEQGYELLSVHP